MAGKLKPGQTGEASEEVLPENLATRMGSGAVEVYATPALLALMEKAAIIAGDHLLEPGQVTVGTAANLKHLAATPLGMTVTAKAELVEIDGRRLVWRVEARDEKEKVAEGTHERFIVQAGRFGERARKKAEGQLG